MTQSMARRLCDIWASCWAWASLPLSKEFKNQKLNFFIAVRFGEKKLTIWFFILTESTNVTDRHTHRQTDRQTPHDGIGHAYAQHRALKTSPKLVCDLRMTWLGLTLSSILLFILQARRPYMGCSRVGPWGTAVTAAVRMFETEVDLSKDRVHSLFQKKQRGSRTFYVREYGTYRHKNVDIVVSRATIALGLHSHHQ